MPRSDRSSVAPRLASLRRLCAITLVALACVVRPGYAAEDWSAFLDALKARGYNDVALVYLKQLQDEGQVPPELDAELDYRIGAAAFDEAIGVSGTRRESLLNQASDAFENYLSSHPDGPSALEATSGLARIAASRGARLFDEANRKGVQETVREEKLALARKYYSDAKTKFSDAIKLARERVQSLQNAPSAQLNELRAAQAHFLDLDIRNADTIAQIARVYPKDSEAYKSGLTAAAESFNRIFTTYQQFVGAYQARFAEAVIAHELDDDDKALEILSEIGVLPFEETFYSLKTRSLALFAEIVDSRNDPALLMELVQKFLEWSDGAKLPDLYYQSAEGRRIYYLSGKALVRLEKLRRSDFNSFAAAGHKTFVDADDPAYKILNVSERSRNSTIVTAALRTLSVVGSGRTEDALNAQELLKDEIFEGIDIAKYSFTQKATDFNSAADIATRAAAVFSEKRMSYLTADPEVQDEAKLELDLAARNAREALRTAIDFSAKELRPDRRGRLPEETVVATLEERANLTLRLAVVEFMTERYENAFVAADAVARIDDFEDAAQGAIVALRSLQTIHANAKKSGSDEIDALDKRVMEYLAFTYERWGEDESSPIAQEAIVAQLDVAAESGDVIGATDALAKIPDDSPRRAHAELKLGQLMWSLWIRLTSERTANVEEDEDGGYEASDLVEPDAVLELACQSLLAGLERQITSDEGVAEDDWFLIFSTYLLAQTYAQQGDFANAEKWLTHPKIGALAVVDRVSQPDAEPLPFVDDSFKVAVLALELRVAANNPDRADDAVKTMARLDSIVENSEDGENSSAKLTRVYLAIGKRFEERVVALKKQADAGDDSKREELANASKVFETFLDKVADREEGNSYASLRWIAESYLAIGKGFLDKNGRATPESAPSFAKARQICKKLVDNINADPNFAPSPDASLAVLLKVCEIMRYEGKYQTAYKNLVMLLESSPLSVEAQWETATLLGAWGDVDPRYYTKAIAGDTPTDPTKRLVWGWNGLMRRLAPSIDKGERFRTLYFDACKEKVWTRYKYVRSIGDPVEKKRQAQAAEDEVLRFWQMHPGFNGPESTKIFNDAYRAFQRLRGVAEPVGLKDSAGK